MAKGSRKKTVCPRCGAKVPVFPDYPTWCECGWNVEPADKPPPKSRLGRWLVEVGKKRGQAVTDAFLEAPEPGETSLGLKVALYTLAASVHLLNLLFVAAGLYLLFTAPRNPFAVPAYLILLAMGWFGRPRFGRMPEGVAANNEFPVLHAVARRAAWALGMPFFDAIVITGDMNAGVARVGPRRLWVLRLGAPLFVALDAREKVALLGHELAHFATIDPRENAVLSVTMRTLDEWASGAPRTLFRLAGLQDDRVNIPGAVAYVVASLALTPVFVVMGVAPTLYLIAFTLLTSGRRQRHEYYSDYLAGRLAGVEAAVSLMRTLLVADAFKADLEAAREERNPTSVRRTLARLRGAPGRELARLERVDGRKPPALGASHPRIAHRIAAVRKHVADEPLIEISNEEGAALREELRAFVKWDDRGLVSALRRVRRK